MSRAFKKDSGSRAVKDSGGIWHLWLSLSTATHHFLITNTAVPRGVNLILLHSVSQISYGFSRLLSLWSPVSLYIQPLPPLGSLWGPKWCDLFSCHSCERQCSPLFTLDSYSPLSLPLSAFPTSSMLVHFTRHTHLDAHWASILADLPLYTIYRDFKVLQRWLQYKSILNFISLPFHASYFYLSIRLLPPLWFTLG